MSHSTAQLDPIDPGHLPVGEKYLDPLGRQQVPRGGTILRHEAFVTQLRAHRLEHEPAGGVVVGDQDAQLTSSSRSVVSALRTRANSLSKRSNNPVAPPSRSNEPWDSSSAQMAASALAPMFALAPLIRWAAEPSDWRSPSL